MDKEEREVKEVYVEPKVIATYEKEELQETIKPHGPEISPPGQAISGSK